MKFDSVNKRSLGSVGEEMAVKYILNLGYDVLDRNYRFKRLGEIDIVAKEGDFICFVEVKLRTSFCFGTPSEAINKKKRLNILKVAYIYLNEKKISKPNIRFDVVEIYIDKITKRSSINLIKNAFTNF